MQIRPYLIVPKLIPQPTWGGSYVLDYKGVNNTVLRQTAIGQSYELSSESNLSLVQDSDNLALEVGDSKTGQILQTLGEANSLFSLQELIAQNPEKILGQHALETHGEKMNVLIKFTQAKGNSFQVHVQPGKEFGHWKPKPESWYFFEQGKATLGLKDPTSQRLDAYKHACAMIMTTANALALEISEGKKTVEESKQLLKQTIIKFDPFEYVNIIDVPKESVIDLSSGGIHHSWEEGNDIPLGNVVYEVQVNVMDNDCTLRSFDKGKIGEDGSIRPVHINDYFQALETDPKRNDVAGALQVPVTNEKGIKILFNSPYYSSEQIEFSSTFTGHTSLSFHHLFVKEGEILLQYEGGELRCGKGSSVYIPASIGEYDLKNNSACQLIRTWV